MGKAKEPKLDEWQAHILGCDNCKLVDVTSPASLIHCCIKGAPSLRDHLAAKAASKTRAKNRALKAQFTDDNHCSAKRMREQMRYVKTGAN